jgi:hypothetical protein
MADNSNQPKAPLSARPDGGATCSGDPRYEGLAPIMEMLKTLPSEKVRTHLQGAKFDGDDISAFYLSKTDLDVKDLLDTPFFTIKGLRPISEPSIHKVKSMSSDVSKSKRAVLNDFYNFNVEFVHWKNFSDDVCVENIDEKAELPERGAARVVAQLARISFEQVIYSPADERLELGYLAPTLNQVLPCFGFLFVPVAGSNCDIEVCTTGASAAGTNEANGAPEPMKPNKKILFLEGKESCKLPRRSTDRPELWADLCLFGFATKIARTRCVIKTLDSGRLELSTLLALEKNLKPLENKATTQSQMVDELLSSPPKERIQAVIKQLNMKKIEPTDAVYLWAAVMQACHYSVPKKRNRSIVLSARMFWFIELEKTTAESQGKCTVKISDAYVVGSQHFMRTLVSFLLCAEDQVLDESQLREWQKALSLPSDGAGDTRPAPSYSSEPGGEGDTKPAAQPEKRHKKSDQGGNSGTSPSRDETVISTAVSVDDDDDDSDKPMATDEYGVIPWFDQIDSTHAQVLGVGRAGRVTQVKWKGKDVALKTFSLQHDDERHLHDIYHHELEVLHSLRSLWGTHVPALLFHIPWATSPMIGLQLGEQLQDDMSEWTEEDRKCAEDTMEKVKELGWEQEDVRGANFVRLTGLDGVARIAMIDFESVVKMT